MITRGNPLGIDATGQVQVDVEGQIKLLHQRVQAAEQDRSPWLTKQRILVEQRRGIRKEKVIPWNGANNDNWPVTDGVIRRWKPGIVSLVRDADPVAYFFATKPEALSAAQVAQAFYHWKFTKLPDTDRTVMELSDLIAQHGLAYTRQGWKYTIERTCRVVRSDSLFPGGVQAALDATNQNIAQQNAQIEQAAAAGQLPPGVEPQPQLDAPTFVKLTLQQEYDLDDGDLGHDGTSQLDSAVEKLIQGAPYIKVYYKAVTEDRPSWQPLSPLDVVVPITGQPAHDAEFVAIVHRMTADKIRCMVRDGHFRPDAAEEVIAKIKNRVTGDTSEDIVFDARTSGARAQVKRALDSIEGIAPHDNGVEPGLEPVWEIYCKLDIDGDGIGERCIVWYHPASAMILSITEYPYPFRCWPIVAFEFEHTSPRPYQSRGIAELCSTFQKHVNKLHNARLDAVQVLLSPMFKYRSSNGEIPRNMKFRPGAMIPLSEVDDLQPLVQDFRPLTMFLTEEQFTKGLAEQYIGVFDSSLTQVGGTGRERRTATEVEAVTAQIGNVFSQDATLFQASMAEVHRQLWQLWLEFGPEQEFFRVTGEEQPRLARKQEINRDFDIYPAGTPANTNKALALARAREMIQLFAQDATGLIDKYRLFKNYMDLTDRNFSKLVVRKPEEASAVQAIMQAAQGKQGLTDQERARMTF